MTRALRLGVTLLILLSTGAAVAGEVLLWHAYRGDEKTALEAVVKDFEQATPGVTVRVLAVPADAYTNKLTTAIPRGNGPDVFIGAHDQIGHWAQTQLIEPTPEDVELDPFHPLTLEALVFEGTRYGLPLAFKSPVLIYNTRLLEEPPADTDALLRIIEAQTDLEAGRYGLVYEVGNFYHHSAWLHGFGGSVFEGDSVQLDTEANAASFAFASRLAEFMPSDMKGAKVKQLFNEGRAAMVIDGPWFLDQIDGSQVDYAVAVLPKVSETDTFAAPFVTAEGVFLSSYAKSTTDGARLAAYLATTGATRRATQGGQMVAYLPAYAEAKLDTHPEKSVFLAQLDHTVPMSNRPEMSAVWAPAGQALAKVLYGSPDGTTPYWMLLGVILLAMAGYCFLKLDPTRPETLKVYAGLGIAALIAAVAVAVYVLGLDDQSHGVEPAAALSEAQARFNTALAPPAEGANPAPYVVLLLLVVGVLGVLGWRGARRQVAAMERKDELKLAAAYVMPTAVALTLLVFAPFAVGTALSLFSYEKGEFVFVGMQNFGRLFSGDGTSLTDSLSFYFTLVVTVLWTALNVFLHVAIGVGLALLLRDPALKMRGIYRVLLIVPWAVPNYITALIWRGMFDSSQGAVNGLLTWLGMEPVEWFNHFLTSFTANLITNTWLGFPFMMVVTLGALQAIPKDLEAAAEVDGASKWQRFRHITLPLLKPALTPAVVLGSVWTFNMFNIIYLVSAGNPDSSTEILISEAYKWAFERGFQYGYAAAYATLIFFILLGYTQLTNMLLRNKEA